MATAVASSSSSPNTKHHHNRFARPPILLSDNDQHPRRLKPRQVTSRYLSISSSSSSYSSNSTTTTTTTSSSESCKRSQSPAIRNRASNALNSTPRTQPRSLSADRRRPAGVNVNVNVTTPLLKSVRSLSVSFQGESYSMSKPEAKTPADSRKLTPERRKPGVTPVRDGRENCRPPDHKQQLWPGRLRADNPSIMTRSLDFGADRTKLTRSGTKTVGISTGNNINNKSSNDLFSSDTDSVSSKSTTGSERSSQLKGRPRGIARFPPMETSRIHNAADKVNFVNKLQSESQVALCKEVSVSRGLSPLRRGVRAVSPMKTLAASPTSALLRGKASPIRNRGGLENSMNNGNVTTSSILSFANDVRRGKSGESRISDAHELRMLYNRRLQWRLVNARAEKSLAVKISTAERSLYNAWSTISRLRLSVKAKRIELQKLRNNMKLYTILKEQEPHLEIWGREEFYHCNSVSGAIKALEASTICLPIAGARIDAQQLQDAIRSAVDVMQAIVSSTCPLVMKVENMNLLVSELSEISAKEHGLLDECKELLSTTIMPLQVTQWSLRSHVLQAQRASKGNKEVLP